MKVWVDHMIKTIFKLALLLMILPNVAYAEFKFTEDNEKCIEAIHNGDVLRTRSKETRGTRRVEIVAFYDGVLHAYQMWVDGRKSQCFYKKR